MAPCSDWLGNQKKIHHIHFDRVCTGKCTLFFSNVDIVTNRLLTVTVELVRMILFFLDCTCTLHIMLGNPIIHEKTLFQFRNPCVFFIYLFHITTA